MQNVSNSKYKGDYVAEKIKEFAVGIALSPTEAGRGSKYTPLQHKVSDDVNLEIHGMGGDWIHINHAGGSSNVIATLDATRTKVMINHPANTTLTLTKLEEYVLKEFTKQVHLECLRAGTKAVIGCAPCGL